MGSGGSRTATELGRLGVSLLLLDRPGELLEEHNIIRHLLGYDSLGKPKLTEVARHIHNINPSVYIETREIDVTAQKAEFAKLVSEFRPDLILVCTDNEQSKHTVDEVAFHIRIPTVGAGVYDGGIGGEVYSTRPKRPCYGCIAIQLQSIRYNPDKGPNIDYNNLDVDEIRTTCALNLDIEQIAVIQARIALNLLGAFETDLLGLPPEVNLCVFANRVVPEVFIRPLHCEFYSVPKSPECLLCGDHSHDVEATADQIITSLTESTESGSS